DCVTLRTLYLCLVQADRGLRPASHAAQPGAPARPLPKESGTAGYGEARHATRFRASAVVYALSLGMDVASVF
ncbi:MAG: hypothetical protein ACK4GC_15635, partial [Paracoccaceae bacterium]